MRRVRRFCSLGLLLSLLLTAVCQGQSADDKLQQAFRSYLDESFALRPLDATMLGDHRFDARLDDISSKARAEWLRLYRRWLEKLEKEFATSDLSANGKVDFQIFRDELVRSIWLSENTRPFEEDPRTYGSYINDSVYSLLAQSPYRKNRMSPTQSRA